MNSPRRRVRRKEEVVRVFLASPGDTAKERTIVRQAVDEINRSVGRHEGFHLDLLAWESDSHPAVGTDAQSIINEQIGAYDIFLALMSTKFGTATSTANSGTEEEFEHAFRKHLEAPGSVSIMFYFGDPTVKLSTVDAYELLRIRRFRDSVRRLGIYDHSYDSPDELHRQLLIQLPAAIHEHFRSGTKAVAATPTSVMQRPPVMLNLPDWNATTNLVYPQGASYRDVPLEPHSFSGFTLRGSFVSASPRFRIGFKLLTARGQLFGDTVIISNDNNIVLHIGKNATSPALFFASFINGRREAPDKSLLDYSTSRVLRIELSASRDDVLSLAVDDQIIYRLHAPPNVKERLIILAWADGEDFDAYFHNIVLQLT